MPEPPAWRVPWESLVRDQDWLRAMAGCPQDPVHHPEGDVLTHVGLVAEALSSLEAWRALPAAEREIVFAAVLLHDVAKPACTRQEGGGRMTSRGHSGRGAREARRLLWEMGTGFAVREQVCALVLHHQVPFYLLERPDAARLAFLVSQMARCDWLALLAEADARGRTSADREALRERVALFAEFCREHGCLDRPRAFASGHSRFEYFRTPGRDPAYHAYEDFRCRVTVLSGLPGAGKDWWIGEHRPDVPVISLDALREELDAAPTSRQGTVVQTARERARAYLRTGTDFVWNATNVSREVRGQVVDLLTAYRAHVTLVYVEASAGMFWAQNRDRERPVPEEAIGRLLARWEVPGPEEAQVVEWWVEGTRVERHLS